MPQRFLPPEWYPQSGIILTWPHEHSDWDELLTIVEPVFIEISREITKRELLLLVVYDQKHQQHVLKQLTDSNIAIDNIRFACIPSNDTWQRDYGPITLIDGERVLLQDFTFNGWGNKFDASLDTRITRHIYNHGLFPSCTINTLDFVLEGGSIESDGQGTILTTSNCLMSPERNPRYSKSDIEDYLYTTIAAKRLLWLDHGHLEGDDTDSHIDTIARFTDENTIAYVQCDDENDSHYDDMQAMERELKNLRNANNEPYRLVPLPWPSAKLSITDSRRLPATYANFLIINSAVLVPTYEDKNDQLALDQLKECFPDREIIGINCLPIIEQHGSLHCLTMQLPEGVLV
ncbi:MAG: agmatine deiminase family protein [Gammaproteobacteria bacterium]|nr:agmatine deiminase family protein [Gammaproteobacteria bacterium]